MMILKWSSYSLQTMVYKRLVEIGRVVFIAKGDNEGKLATIVNVIDGNKVRSFSICSNHARCALWLF